VYVPPLAFVWWLSRYVPPDRLDDTVPDGIAVSAVYPAQIHHPVSQLHLCAVLLHTMPEPALSAGLRRCMIRYARKTNAVRAKRTYVAHSFEGHEA
jgi:hypothetical protein